MYEFLFLVSDELNLFTVLQVMHSKTSSPSSYSKDFRELVLAYTSKRTEKDKSHCLKSVMEDPQDASEDSCSTASDSSDDEIDEQDDELSSMKKASFSASEEQQLSVEFLEDDFDDIQTADDFDGMQTYSLLTLAYCLIIC